MEEDLGIVECIYSAPDSSELLVLYDEGVRIYDFSDNPSLTLSRTVKKRSIKGVGVISGQWSVIIQHGGELSICDFAEQKASLKLEEPPDNVTFADWSPDGKWIACGAGDFRVALWCAKTGKKLFERKIPWRKLDPPLDEGSQVCQLKWSADSKQFAVLPASLFHRQVVIVNAATGDFVAIDPD